MVTDSESVSFFIIGDWGGIPVFPFKYYDIFNAIKIFLLLTMNYYTKGHQLKIKPRIG